MLTYQFGFSHEFFSNVLGTKRVAIKFVKKLLNLKHLVKHKQRRMESLTEIKNDAELLKRVLAVHNA